MAIFGPKPWVNPFGKISIFRLFKLCVFITQKGFFCFQNIVKHIFLAYIALKKKVGKWPLLDQKYGLTLWKNLNFLTFLTFRFYSLERCFLVLEYRKRHFSGIYCLKKECLKNVHFRTKTMGEPRWKNVNFSTFSTLCFYSLERCFLVLEYRKRHFPGL